ncbi:MAG TPA: beta-ketoacyl synthase N-terminal-like domain-containing protein [Thermoanaerobaculia bacterium]|nr:beta-ketoacyl synthase N-terminal-like domain-containing protein [Thermoanaerobaculia bacterium]
MGSGTSQGSNGGRGEGVAVGGRRIGVFGWGIVAPRSANVDEFAANLEAGGSWLAPFDGFGPSNFLVGTPKLDFSTYRPWIDARHPPNRYSRLVEKMDPTTLLAVAAFLQSLGQNPGLEEELAALGGQAHVYVGTGLGALPTIYHESVSHHRTQCRWNRFWAQPERNSALASYRADGVPPDGEPPPPDPEAIEDPDAREDAEEVWSAFWAARSERLAEFLVEHHEIENLAVRGEVEAGKRALLREKQRRHARLQEKYGSPPPPWGAVSANLLWNIQNTPASQISILGRITGPTLAPGAACSTFGMALKLAMDAIRSGEARAVVIGAADPPPHPLTVSAFFNARVLAGGRDVSKPLSELRGTHVSGGSAIWILGDYDYFVAKGMRPVGLEPLAVGLSSDADHIITPSKEGPQTAIRAALAAAGVPAGEIAGWDMHATATPGDYLEVENLRTLLPDDVLVTARKGIFGHGMGVAGGWELTAQYLGYARGRIDPTPLAEGELNEMIGGVHRRFVFDHPVDVEPCPVGKLSMGVGGINACVISRPWR